MTHVHDLIGVGYGPGNLALAIAVQESDAPLDAVFLESRRDPGWQSEMALTGADIQHNPVRDLVSLRNPRSRYSFVNYLHENGRLLRFLNLPAPLPLRSEYVRYIDWVRATLGADVRYGESVTSIRAVGPEGACFDVTTNTGRAYRARSVVLGPGRTPRVPAEFQHLMGPQVFHLTDYLRRLKLLPTRPGVAQDRPHVLVVGGSQSAVEIALDAMDRFPDGEVTVLTRSWSLRAKDHSPFSEEIYLPEFTDYYHRASPTARRRLDAFTRPTNYSAADLDVLERLYMRMYEEELEGRQRVRVVGDSHVQSASMVGDRVNVCVTNATTDTTTSLDCDLVVLATGFKDMGKGDGNEPHHPLLDEVADLFARDENGALHVNLDYSLEPLESGAGGIYLNGLCESSHGIGDAGSFSLLSLRAERILGALTANVTAQELMESNHYAY